jgi:hypothetical protein
LLAEAAARATSRSGPHASDGDEKPPPSGWRAPDQEAGRGDLDVIVQVVESLRELIPPDLQRRLTEALRELLLAVRALIDWYVDRLDKRRPEPPTVEDIPIL